MFKQPTQSQSNFAANDNFPSDGGLWPMVRKEKKPKEIKAPPKEKKKKLHWLEFVLTNVEGNTLPFVDCKVHFADGKVVQQRSNDWGVVRIDGLEDATNYRVSFPEWKEDGDALGGEPKIELLTVDEQFAPQAEDLQLQYSIQGLEKEKVFVEILTESHEKTLVYRRQLTLAEKTAGKHTLGEAGEGWNGVANSSDGPFEKGQYVDPLYSPYTIRIQQEDGIESEALTFHIKYHSISLGFGTWSASGVAPQKNGSEKWVKYRLNELGYHAGPLEDDSGKALAKAIFAYRQNDPELRKEFEDWKIPSEEERTAHSAISDDLVAALKKEQAPRHSMDNAAFLDESTCSGVFVEELPYSEEDFEGDRAELEDAFINPPLIPVDTRVFLASREGIPVFSESAVGDIRVNWRIIEESGDEAQTSPAQYALLDLAYWPYYVQEDGEKGCIYTSACIDPAYPEKLGIAGFFFRPPYAVGKGYRLEASLDFSDHRNGQELAAIYAEGAEAGSPLTYRTGLFELKYAGEGDKAQAGATWSTNELRYGDEVTCSYQPPEGEEPLADGALFSFRIYRKDVEDPEDNLAEITDVAAKDGVVKAVWDYDGDADSEEDEEDEEDDWDEDEDDGQAERIVAGIDESELVGIFPEFYFEVSDSKSSKRSELLKMNNWIDVQFLKDDDTPYALTPYTAYLPDDSTLEGETTEDGEIFIEGLPFGDVKIEVDGFAHDEDDEDELDGDYEDGCDTA
jgi:hypothetical protein